MKEPRISQLSGNDSMNIQNNDLSKNNIIINNNGINYIETKQMINDMLSSEMTKFKGEALQIINTKMDDFSSIFLQSIINKNPNFDFSVFSMPSVQNSISNAMKGYCLDEREQLGYAFINMLIDRISIREKNVLQISIDEAIKILPNLTSEQLDTLTMLFLLLTGLRRISSLDSLKERVNLICNFYHESLNITDTCVFLKIYNTCVSLDEAKSFKPIEEIFRNNMTGLFFKGFNEDELTSISGHDLLYYNRIIIRSLRDVSKYQFNTLTQDILKSTVQGTNLQSDYDLMAAIFSKNTMTIEEIKRELIDINPKIERLLSDWRNSDYKYLCLTPIGKVIAIANYNNKLNKNLKYSDYIS